MHNQFSAHPLWQVGFRPFFSLACLAGLSLPLLWVLILGGIVAPPVTSFSMFQWHAHEMFFGFGWAVLGGFLLTSTKNWVAVRGYHGNALIFLVTAWLFERAGMWFEGSWPPFAFHLSNNLFLGSIAAMLMSTLIRHRQTDSYRDNYFFLIVLPLFLLAKHQMLGANTFPIGSSMALGLFRLAFLVMLERTLTPFMKSNFQVTLVNKTPLNKAIKFLGLLMVFESLLPAPLSGWIALLLALLLAGRFAFWQPQLALRRLEVGIMYLGYAAIVAQLFIVFLDQIVHPVWVGAVSIHVFTVGAMGMIVPAMLVRISKGHTGRKVVFDRIDKLVLWIMILAFVARIVGPQFFPAGYLHWLYLTAICWLLAFGILGWRYVPYLAQARVDGRDH